MRLAEEAAGEDMRKRTTMKIWRVVRSGLMLFRMIRRTPDIPTVLPIVYM